MSQNFTRANVVAPVDATYLTRVPEADLTGEFALSTLSTGYLKHSGGTPTSQAVPIPIADGGSNNTAFANTNGIIFKNSTQLTSLANGTTGQVLHGITGAAPAWSSVSLTADVGSSVLPIANGGTNNATAYTAGRVMFFDGTRINQSQGTSGSAFTWDDTDNVLLFGGDTQAAADVRLHADGQGNFNDNNLLDVEFRVESDSFSSMFCVSGPTGVNNTVHLHAGAHPANHIADFDAATPIIIFNDDADNRDWRVEGQTLSHLWFLDASADMFGVGASSPHTTLDIRGALACNTVEKTANYTITGADFHIRANAEPSVAGITITLPDATNFIGAMFIVTKVNATAAKTVSISPQAGQTIDGAATVIIATQWTCRGFVAFSGAWRLVFSKGAL